LTPLLLLLLAAWLAAVQEAGIPRKLAPTIGIAVDNRRRNRSLESLQVRL
jgi:large subunit ribosomal protein L13e